MATLSPERRAALDKEKSKHHSGGSFFKMTGTKAIIRLLPLAADEEIGTKVVQHFIANKGYTCPMGTHGRPGVIDTAVRALRKLGDAESAEIADGLEANCNTKYCLKIIDRANPSTPLIYRAPYSVYKVAFQAFDIDAEDIADATDGCDIRISKEGSGMATKYDVRLLKPAPLLADEDGNPLKKATKELLAASSTVHTADLARCDEQGAFDALADNIPKHLWKQIKAEVSAVLDGTSDGEDGEEAASAPKKSAGKKAAAAEDDEDEVPAKPAKKAAKPAAEDDADGDEEDDQDEAPPAKKPKASLKPADDEDDEPAPAKPAKKAAKPPVDEDDEDEEPVKPAKKATKPVVDEDDEDEEPAPKKPAAKKPAVIDEDDDEEQAKPAKKTAPDLDEDDEDEEPVAKKPVSRFKPRA